MNSDFLYKPGHKLSTYFEDKGKMCKSNVLFAAQYRHIEHEIKGAKDFNALKTKFEIKMLDKKTRLYELKFQKIRVIHFIYINGTFVYLGTFIKKSGQTPKAEIEKNNTRIHEYEELHNETDTHN